MTTCLFTVLAVLSAWVLPLVAASDSLSWTIYHSWNQNQDFVQRGQLVLAQKEDSEKNDFQIVNDQELQPKDIQEMLDYGWYHVKIQGSDNQFVFQTVPACNLRRANFKDQFEITLPRSSLGNKQDPLTSFSYTPLVSPLAPKTCEDYEQDDANKQFSSRVSVQLDTPAMVLKTVLSSSKPPPGIAFAKGPAGSKDDENGGNPAPDATPSPFGFFSKYWYIILPMLILQMITEPNEEGQQQQQQGGEGQQQQGATIAPPQAAAGQKARRGKTSRSKN